MSTPPIITNYDNIPQELKDLKQWVCWKWGERNGKNTKIPVQWNGNGNASTKNPDHWGTFEQCYNASGDYAGVGFVFTNSPYSGIDLDHCFDDSQSIERWAQKIINDLDSYTDISPSGQGIHIIVKGKKPADTSCRTSKLPVEIYDDGRYFTMTGNLFPNTSGIVQPAPNELAALCLELFGSPESNLQETKASPTVDVILSDQDIIQKAITAKNGKGEKFARLYAGEISDHNNDHSAADQALCNHLAFWTGRDPNKIDTLFRQSGLYRDKWDTMHGAQTYGQMTISKAIADCKQVYTPRQKPTSHKKTLSDANTQSLQRFNYTDYGNAERLTHLHGQDVRYCKAFGKWYVWDGKRFEEDVTDAIVRRAKDTVRSLYAEAAECRDSAERKAIASFAKSSESASRIRDMITLAKSEERIAIRQEELDSDYWLLNCSNGTIDLRTGKLLPHQRERIITKLAPVDYNPTAECPTWISFLNRILDNNQSLISYLQRAIGYSLTGDTREHAMFFLYGTGRNGKSTFLDAIRDILGDYAQQATTETLMTNDKNAIPTDIASLKGSRFVMASEGEEGRKLAEGTIKNLTGDKQLKARFMRQDHFVFEKTFKIFFATNHKPIIRGTDKAIWERIKLIPFTVYIPDEERDRLLPEKLKAEYSGILRWAVDGCMDWLKNGLGEPAEVKTATAGYRAEMDALAGFIAERCILSTSVKVEVKLLYDAYCVWCESNRERPQGKIKFNDQIKERGISSAPGNCNKLTWFGIGLLATVDDPEGENKPKEDTPEGEENKPGNGVLFPLNPLSNSPVSDMRKNNFCLTGNSVTEVTEVTNSVVAEIKAMHKCIGPYECQNCSSPVDLLATENPQMAGEYVCEACKHTEQLEAVMYSNWLADRGIY